MLNIYFDATKKNKLATPEEEIINLSKCNAILKRTDTDIHLKQTDKIKAIVDPERSYITLIFYLTHDYAILDVNKAYVAYATSNDNTRVPASTFYNTRYCMSADPFDVTFSRVNSVAKFINNRAMFTTINYWALQLKLDYDINPADTKKALIELKQSDSSITELMRKYRELEVIGYSTGYDKVLEEGSDLNNTIRRMIIDKIEKKNRRNE